MNYRARAWGVCLTAVLLVVPALAQGATIEVDTTADQNGSKPKACALREAVIAANGDEPFGGCKKGNESDKIVLRAKTYELTRSGSGEDEAAKGDLDVTENLELRGASQNRTTIDARDASDRHFEAMTGVTLDLRDLTLDKGSLDEFNGGAIVSTQGALNLDHVTVRRSVGPGGSAGIYGNATDTTINRSLIEKNHAQFAGGGISTGGGTLTITRSRISNNRSDTFAGGVYPNNTETTIKRSVIQGNRAADQGGIAQLAGILELTDSRVVGNKASDEAGGMYFLSTDAQIRRSEVSGNVSGGRGGGLYVASGDVDIIASTISGNRADSDGGGILLDGASSELVLNGVTLAHNEADAESGSTGTGGGIFVDDGAGIFYNSIIAENSTGAAGPSQEPDCDGGIAVVYSLIGNDCPGLGANNIVGEDPGLKKLKRNGGPTLTHALRADSLAVNAGNPSLPGSEESACVPEDQRGLGRPTGECDMGAFELDGF
jgi:CSLREA domain-containing protein